MDFRYSRVLDPLKRGVTECDNRKKNLLRLSFLQSEMKFIFVLLGNPPSVRLDLYRNSALNLKDYAIPSRPGKPEVKSKTHDTVEIQWRASDRGTQNLLAYEVC